MPGKESTFAGQRVVVVGGGARLGRALVRAVSCAGAEVVVAGRHRERIEAAAAETGPSASSLLVDFADRASVDAFAAQLGAFDHLVSTVSMHAGGPLRSLEPEKIDRAFDAKVLSPLRLVQQTADMVRAGGSYTFFSGQAAWRPGPGAVVTATVNGALAFMVQALAVELAPVRVNAIAPGLVDSGALDALGEERKREVVRAASERNPVRRVGQPDDVVSATMMVMANGYMTGTVVHVNGGGTLV
jgi:NAD(P)-dependent dehydrogenase (short-subunit alcohol dehydrogenase family)